MDEFNFYLKFAKPLVLNLPDAKDRTTAALWVKKLRDMQSHGSEAEMSTEYLKLLLFVMQRNKLAGIFEKAPPEGPLEAFPSNYKATDMLSLVNLRKAALPVYPPVFTSVGGDLCQFVAVQEIPQFGLHGYYAISMEPLSKWSHASTNAAKKAAMKPKHYGDCYKNSCKLAESTYCSTKFDESSSPPTQSSAAPDDRREIPEQISQAQVDSKNTDPSENKRHLNACEQLPGPTIQLSPLPPIPFQSYRKEIAGFETRPTWGRSRYINRLVDESPHFSADLDVSQADAMLNVMSDKTFKKASNFGPCAISSSRRHVENMLDLPPCAIDAVEMKPVSDSFYTCCPKKGKVIETHIDSCHNERDFHPCGIKSGWPLRGGSDSGGCCGSQNQRRGSQTSSEDRSDDPHLRQYHATNFSRSQRRNQPSRQDSVFEDTDTTLDVDTTIHNALTASKYMNPETSGNFKWLEDMEHITLSDLTEMSDSRTQMRQFSSCTTANEFHPLATEGYSGLEVETPINEQLQPDKLMPQVARRMQSPEIHHFQRPPSFPQQPQSYLLDTGSDAQDNWEQQADVRRRNKDEPSMVILRKRFAQSREATKRNPEIHEKFYRWKEIIDDTECSRDPSLHSKGAANMSSDDLEYLDYIQATRTDGECCYEDDDNETEEPRYTRHGIGQILDEQAKRSVKTMLKPPKAVPSPGRVTMPLSNQSRGRQRSQSMMQVREPPKPCINDKESK